MTDPAAPVSSSSAPAAVTSAVRRFPRQAFPAGTVPRYRPVERPRNGAATASRALGAAALVLCWVPIVGVLCAVLAVAILPAVVICTLVATAG